MKIPAESRYILVYVIEEYQFLGRLIEPYIVQLTHTENLSLVNQRIHHNNADYYDKALDEQDYQALKILAEITPEALTKKFSPVKRLRPKEFFSLKTTDELLSKSIIPYIQKRLANVLDIIKGKPLYIKEDKNVISIQVNWPTEMSDILFHLRENENDLHYFATVKYLNHRVEMNRTDSFLLSENPCILVAKNQLYLFHKDLDGKKLAPFIKKRYLRIPGETKGQFLKTFIAPLLEKYNLYSKGVEIETLKLQATPVLKLCKLLNGQIGFVLEFQYGSFKFPYHSAKKVSVSVVHEHGKYKLIRVKRSIEWERSKFTQLLELDLESVEGSELIIEDKLATSHPIIWLQQNLEILQEQGFKIVQDLVNTYSLTKPTLDLSYVEEGDWFDIKGSVVLGGFQIPFEKIRNNIKDGIQEFVLPNGHVALIPSEWFETLGNAFDFSISKNAIKLHKQHASLFEKQLPDFKIKFNSLAPIESISPPPGFIGTLRSYQLDGFRWMAHLHKNTLGGCLADDMGLGKTIQALALLQSIKESKNTTKKIQMNLFENIPQNHKPSLLVVPTSLIHNWLIEGAKFTPELKLLNHSGQHRSKNNNIFKNFDLVITTYGTLRNDEELFRAISFEIIVLDEGQIIKNPDAKIAGVVADLKANCRITLTGTPVENSVLDLWSQMNFTNLGLLGNQKFFQKKFQLPIEKKKDQNRLDLLKHLIKPFVLRRTKNQVAKELPTKTEQIVYCEMTTSQQELYEKTKSQYRNLILDEQLRGKKNQIQFHLLAGLTKLRQIANHTALYEGDHAAESGKFEEVNDRLQTAIEENHKVLIFSQFVKQLNLYQSLLDGLKVSYCYIDGSVNAKKRQEEVEKFQSDENVKVFLISLKAGGVGLNLTAADYVFLLDPWWNPAAENQAIDRTHRIGQTQKVFSYKFITRDSIEEKILKLQQTKVKLSKELIQSDQGIIGKMNMTEILELLD